MLSAGPFGWSLGMPESIFRGFPDFLLHFDRLMPFYLLFFLAGWWLHREHEALPRLSRQWLADLLAGLIAFSAANWLDHAYSHRPDLSHVGLLHGVASALYGLATALTSFGFVGVFQRYLDRPSPTWRYLADTALWVYLVHQPLVVIGLAWLAPYHLPWWLVAVAVFLFAVPASLLLYEACVRPTILVRFSARPAHVHREPTMPCGKDRCRQRSREIGRRMRSPDQLSAGPRDRSYWRSSARPDGKTA